MVDKLEACPNPWCEGEEGVAASQHVFTGKWHICCDDCMIDGPWADSHSAAIAAWNTRATPANGEQVERVKRACDLLEARYMGEEVSIVLSAARAATLSTPTEDARSRVKVLEEALDYAIEAVGKEADHAMHVTRASRWVVEEIEAKEARFKDARTALGNKETDRHG